MEPRIQKSEKKQNVFYILNWSRLIEADRHEIMRNVPSVSGIFELYYQDIKKQMRLFFVSMAWYGGLRNSIREKTDLEIETDTKRREILEKYKIFFRYSMSDSFGDLKDVLYFFSETYFPDRVLTEDSGRYEGIHVEEVSEDKMISR
jgi:hypothetical protein